MSDIHVRSANFIDVERRSPLERSIPPGERVVCAWELMTPTEDARFELELTLVQEFVAWFDTADPDSRSTYIVNVGEAVQEPLAGDSANSGADATRDELQPR